MGEGHEAPPVDGTGTATSQDLKIDPKILAEFGLTDKDAKEFSFESVNEKGYLERIREGGAKTYTELHDSFNRPDSKGKISAEIAGTFDVKIDTPSFAVPFVPDAINRRLYQLFQNDPDLAGDMELKRRISEWFIGYGKKALETGDWESAVSAIDIATDGRAMEDKDLIDRLREIAAPSNKEKRVSMAKQLDRGKNGFHQQLVRRPDRDIGVIALESACKVDLKIQHAIEVARKLGTALRESAGRP